jgi:hypothetical protein
MSGKRRPKPGVRVICTDEYHRDTEEFARQGFHFLCMMRLFPMADGGFWPNLAGISAAAVAPVKRGIHPDGQRVTGHSHAAAGSTFSASKTSSWSIS